MSALEARLRPDPPSALPRGTRLGEFELLHVLGVGGFGIVYLAFDHALEREVAVKEYMPASLVGRTETLQVTLRSQSDAETFSLGLKSFVNEAKMLARFDHPSLLKVLRFWQANGTAYMAMPVLRGQTAKEARQAMSGSPDEAWLRSLLDPLLGAIERLHAEGVYHRDIAPDNIQIETDGHPVLLDFGAARRVITDATHTLTAILKPAYAPIEQYAEVGSVKQGPWTDLYALGATLHYMLLGRPPLPSTARAVQDDLSPLASQPLPGCSEAFLNVIDWMLAPRPADRPQSAAAVRDVLAGRAPPPRRRAAEPIVSDSQWDNTLIVAPPRPSRAGLAALAASAVAVEPPRRADALPLPPEQDDAEPATMVMPPPRSAQAARAAAAVAQPTPRAPLPRPGLWLSGGALLLAVVGAIAWWPRAEAPPAAGLAAPVQLAAEMLAPTLASPPAQAAVQPIVQPVTQTVVADVPGAVPVLVSPATAPVPLAVAPETLVPAAKPLPRFAEKKPIQLSVQPGATSYRQPAALQLQSSPSVPAPATPAVTDSALKPLSPPSATPASLAADVGIDAAKGAPTGPEARCTGRNALSRFVCMERECLRAEFASHADCKKWRSAAPPRE